MSESIERFERAHVKSLAKRIIAPGATAVTDEFVCFGVGAEAAASKSR